MFTPRNNYYPADAGYDSDDREPLTVGEPQPVFGRVSHEFDDEAHRSIGDQEARVQEAAAIVRTRLEYEQPGQDAEIADGFEKLGRPAEMAGAEGAHCPPAAAVEEAADADCAKHAEDVDRGVVQGVNALHSICEPDHGHQQRHQQRGAEERKTTQSKSILADFLKVFQDIKELAAEDTHEQHSGGKQHGFERPDTVFPPTRRQKHQYDHHHIAQGHEGVVGRDGQFADVYVGQHGVRFLSVEWYNGSNRV